MIERNIDLIVIHASDTYKRMNVGAKWIDELHKGFGWKGIGYHFVIKRDGTIEAGRDVDMAGAHAKGYNASSIGICWIGGKGDDNSPEDNRTPEQKKAMRNLIDVLVHMFPNSCVTGHRDLPGVTKACPCFDVETWYYV